MTIGRDSLIKAARRILYHPVRAGAAVFALIILCALGAEFLVPLIYEAPKRKFGHQFLSVLGLSVYSFVLILGLYLVFMVLSWVEARFSPKVRSRYAFNALIATLVLAIGGVSIAFCSLSFREWIFLADCKVTYSTDPEWNCYKRRDGFQILRTILIGAMPLFFLSLWISFKLAARF